jgi:hypothetical protein
MSIAIYCTFHYLLKIFDAIDTVVVGNILPNVFGLKCVFCISKLKKIYLG